MSRNFEDTLETERENKPLNTDIGGNQNMKLDINLFEGSQTMNYKPLSRQPSSKRGIVNNIVPLSNRRKLVIKRIMEATTTGGVKLVDSGKLLARNGFSGRLSYNNMRGESTRTSILSQPSTSSDKLNKLQGLYRQQSSCSKVSNSPLLPMSKSQAKLPQSLVLESLKTSKVMDE